MRVVNQGGFLHDHITDLRLEEDCNLHGRKKIFHRIWGYDADRQYEIVLDWGIDREEVEDCFRLMQRQLSRGQSGYWNCPRYGLKKEKQEEKKNECSTAGREDDAESGSKIHGAGYGTCQVYACSRQAV